MDVYACLGQRLITGFFLNQMPHDIEERKTLDETILFNQSAQGIFSQLPKCWYYMKASMPSGFYVEIQMLVLVLTLVFMH